MPFENLAKYFHETPAPERKPLMLLIDNLKSLDSYERNLIAAVELLDFCLYQMSGNFGGKRAFSWTFIAGRDAVMTLNHFGETLSRIGRAMAEVPTIRAMVDPTKLRSARKKFREYFPDFEDMRHAVAHAAELYQDSASLDGNVFQGKHQTQNVNLAGKLIISESFDDRQFKTTHEGRILTLEISGTTIERVREVKSEFYAGFPD